MDGKEQVLSYIAVHPGCTSTGVADVVYGEQKWSGWILARRDIGTLIDEDLVEERFDQGVGKFYAKEAVWKWKSKTTLTRHTIEAAPWNVLNLPNG